MKLATASGRQLARDLTGVWRHGGRLGQLAVGGLAAGLAVLWAAAVTLSIGPANDATPLAAVPVRATTPEGGTGVAGLTDAVWRQWAPGPKAALSDAAANILALAHAICDLSGHVRTAGMPSDTWRSAVAAFHSGLNEVVSARGIPKAAAGYVDIVTAYPQWYAQQPDFGGTGDPGATGSSSLTLVDGSSGAQGIAHFQPELWPKPSVSGRITGLGGKCVETAGSADGSAVPLNDCTGAADQAWTVRWPPTRLPTYRLKQRHHGRWPLWTISR